jgi:transcriptional regulator with XRE-family HTH domain
LEQNQPDLFASTLAEVFREAREAAGLSQKKLAEVSGVGRTGIIMLEAGERIPSMLLCQMLADGLKMPLAGLVAELEKRLLQKKWRI